MELDNNKVRVKFITIATLFWILQLQFQNYSTTAAVIETIQTPKKNFDLTIQENTTGYEIVESILHKIHRSQIFPEDFDFLRRIAMIESGYGFDLVESNNFTGGIWRVGEDKYELTKMKTSSTYSSKLDEARRKIHEQFFINWMDTAWDDLKRPFYSALAFRLFFHLIQYQNDQEEFPIPETLESQASHWATYYHNNTHNLSEQNFIYILEDLESKVGVCGGRMDLVVLLDGSGSIGNENFEIAKKFVADLFLLYAHKIGDPTKPKRDNPVRLGFIVYSSISYTMFTLSNKLSSSQQTKVVMVTKYPGQGTNLNGGIIEALKVFNDPHLSYSETNREGVPKIMIVITDGASSSTSLSSGGGLPEISDIPAITLAKSSNITTFAVGVGRLAKMFPKQLLEIAYGQSSHVFTLTEYKTLSEFYRKLNSFTCTVPQTPAHTSNNKNEIITISTDTLFKKETRLYRFDLPENGNGLTIFLKSQHGQVRGFYSYGLDIIPSSVLHDGVLNNDGNGTFLFSPNSKLNQKLKTDALVSASSQGKIKIQRYYSHSAEVEVNREIRTRLDLWYDQENGDNIFNDQSFKYGGNNEDEISSITNILVTIQGLSNFNNYTIASVTGFAQPTTALNSNGVTLKIYFKNLCLINIMLYYHAFLWFRH